MDRVDRVVSFGAIKDSTIVDAKQLPSGHTVALECAKRMPFGLHVTSIYMTAFFVVPFLARSRAEGGDRQGVVSDAAEVLGPFEPEAARRSAPPRRGTRRVPAGSTP